MSRSGFSLGTTGRKISVRLVAARRYGRFRDHISRADRAERPSRLGNGLDHTLDHLHSLVRTLAHLGVQHTLRSSLHIGGRESLYHGVCIRMIIFSDLGKNNLNDDFFFAGLKRDWVEKKI